MLFTNIKIIIAAVSLLGISFVGHKLIVKGLELEISNQKTVIANHETTIAELNDHNTKLKSAAQINEETIQSLQNNLSTQIARMQELSTTNQQLAAEKEEYLSIFRRHDLLRLALARPGLIENRINSGTEDVFRQLEEDTKVLTNEPSE